MYLHTAAFGQIQARSSPGQVCQQDKLPIKFIERIYLSSGKIERVLDRFYFRTSDLRSWHKTWIRRQLVPALASSLKSGQPIRTILLIGHSDQVGSAEANYRMGLARARAVHDFLLAEIGRQNPAIRPLLVIKVLSSGECWPVINNGKSERRNRRVEVLATPELITPPKPPPIPTTPSAQQPPPKTKPAEPAPPKKKNPPDTPIQVLRNAGLKTTTRIDDATPALLQKAVKASRILRPLIQSKLSSLNLTADNFKHHAFDATFDSAYTKLNQIVIPVGSKEEDELIQKRGFYHRGTDSIHLRPAANVGHALHEVIHKLAAHAFRGVFGGYLDEGMTQYFTDLVLQEQGLEPMKRHLYQPHLACAKKMVLVFGNRPVASAYFQGGTPLVDLAKTVVRRLAIDFVELHQLRQNDSLCKRFDRL